MAPYNIPTMFTPSPSYIAEQEGIDPDDFERMIMAESNFNPSAQSSAGAIGLTQLMPGTASDLGVDPYDPIENLYGGARYMKQQQDKYGDLYPVAYNWGPGNTDNWLRNGADPDALPDETRNYAAKLGKPIGELPDLTSPSKYRDVEIQSASLPSTSRRGEDLSRVMEEINSLQDSKKSALEAMTQQGSLDENQALAIALTAIVPTLLGLGFGGKAGAAMGATAGAQGAGVGLQGLTAEMNRRDNANKLLYEDAKSQLSTKEAEAKGIRDSMADREERNSELQYLYGKDGVRKPVSQREYTPEIAQALADAQAGKELTEQQRLAIYTNPRAVDDYDNISKRADVTSRSDAKRELAGRIPPKELAGITADEISIKNYRELANLVQGKDIDTQRIGQVLGDVTAEMSARGAEKFTAAGWDNIFNRVFARSGIEPNSYDAQVLERMKQIGRANAIAQPGVATNEDALQEISFVSIKPGQSVESYLENLSRLADNRAQKISTTLDNLSMNGYPAADKFKQKYYGSGLIPGGATDSTTPTTPTKPQGAVGTKRFRNQAGEEKTFWIDQNGNRLSEAS